MAAGALRSGDGGLGRAHAEIVLGSVVEANDSVRKVKSRYSFCDRCTSRTPGTRRMPCTRRVRWRTSSVSTTNSTMASAFGPGRESTVRIFVSSSLMMAVSSLQHAGPVVAEDRQLHRISRAAAGCFLRGPSPLDRDAAVGFVQQVLHVGTAARMDSNALAARDVADDFFAANRIATSRAVDQQLVLALDLERVRIAARQRDPLDGVGNRRRPESRAPTGLADDTRAEAVQHLARGILAEADRGHQVVGRGDAVFGGDARVIGLIEFRERDLVLARFALEQLAADLDGALALMLVEPVLDLVAGPRALHEAEPVAARACGRSA